MVHAWCAWHVQGHMHGVQGVLMVANRIVTDRRDEQNVRYPAGRSKLESIGAAACSSSARSPGSGTESRQRHSWPPAASGALALAHGGPPGL